MYHHDTKLPVLVIHLSCYIIINNVDILLYSLSRNKIGDAGAKHLADFFLGNNCKQLEKLRYSYKIYQSVYL